jgi:O-antigen/teichoic acid export membrane protein
MEDPKRKVKNSLIYLAPIIAGSALPLITLPIFTRILTAEDYGVLALAQVYATFVTGLFNFGLIIGYERNFFQYTEENAAAQLLYSTLSFVVSAFLVCAVLTYVLKTEFSKWIIGSAAQGDLLFWAFCSTGIMSLKNYYLTYYKNTENAKAFVWYTIDESVLGTVLSLFLVAYVHIGVIGIVWGQLSASLVILSVVGYKFLKHHPPAFNLEILKDSLRLSVPLTPRIFLGVIGNQFDKYMIGLLATVGGVGIYSIGQKIAYMVFSFMSALQNAYSPQVYKRMFADTEMGGESIGRYLTPFAYYSVAGALLVALFSEEVIFMLVPSSYYGSIEIIIILSMFYASTFFGKQPQLIFARKTYLVSAMTMINITLNILINIPFILKWGIIGAAWGTLSAGLISGAISLAVSQRYYAIQWEYKKIIPIFALFFASAIAMIAMRNGLVPYSFRIVVKLFFVMSYVYIGVIMGVITPENFQTLRSAPVLRWFASKRG